MAIIQFKKPHLYIIRGLPGSGKTTLGLMIADELNALHYEADMFFFSAGEYLYKREFIADAHKWCFSQVKEGLEEGHTVVVSNVFHRKSNIRPYTEMAIRLGLKYTIIHCEGNYGNVHGVSERKVEQFRKDWEYWDE